MRGFTGFCLSAAVIVCMFVFLAGCATIRQVSEAPDGTRYESIGIAFGKGTIADLATSFERSEVDGESLTQINQKSSGLEADIGPLVAGIIAALQAAGKLASIP